MYLKSIDIHGFKSFADKTTFTFLPPKQDINSLTVIVGPNGSGKSNVSDAIRWVMGEQSMKQLRGRKASDIIFSGSAAKGAMSVASVMMTLDNRDGRVAVDYDELIIGRRIYRSGESEYILNGQTVRLIDLQLLLAKAQFGEGAYAVIGQGMIDRLLLQSSQERKDFFDEAAGIKEFQIKRHQAMLRLARTREHITQAELLVQEISPRLKMLSKQVKKLEQRQELEINLRDAQEQYYSSVYQHQEQQVRGVKEEIDTIALELQKKQEQLLSIQQELAALAQGASRQEIFSQLEQQYQELVSQKNKQERERAILQGKLQTEYTKSGNHQMGWLESKIDDLKIQQQTYDHQVKDMEQACRELTEQIQQLRKQYEQLQLSRMALKGDISTREAQLLRVKSEQSAFQITGFHAVQAILEARQLSGIYGVVAQLGKVDARYIVALDVAAGYQLASVVVDHEDTAKAAVAYLREQKLGVATFLPLHKIRPRDVPPYVYDLATQPGVHGLAIDLVRHDAVYAPIFQLIFGSTLVVDDFATAKRVGIGRVRMVTLEGDLFEMSGAIKGGYRQQKQQGVSFAGSLHQQVLHTNMQAYEEEIQQKHLQLIDEEQQEEQVRVLLTQEQTALETSKQKRDFLQDQKQQIDAELARLEQEFALSTMSEEQYGDIMQQITLQKEHIDQEIVLLTTQLEQAKEAMALFNEEEEKKKQRVFALQDDMQQQQVLVNRLVEEKNTKQVVLAKLETKQEDIAQEAFQELHAALALILDKKIDIVGIDHIEELQAAIQKLKYQLSLIGGIDEEVVTEYEETKTRHDGVMTQLTDLRKALDDLETLIIDLDGLMKKKRNKAFKQIRQEFARYFSQLFSGGEADLVELYGDEQDEDIDMDSDMPLSQEGQDEVLAEDAPQTHRKKTKKVLKGIDILACPPGKKIKHIQALSGGERTMTSIALMCAILKTNPSPFIVFDEVEAALDEANTLRVVNILKELAALSQFIIITHNKVTMHAADALYGVTMGKDGMSHVVSMQLGEAAG